MTYKTRIHAWLTGKRLTLEEGAAILGCSTAALCRWRAGQSKPQGLYRTALETALERWEREEAR